MTDSELGTLIATVVKVAQGPLLERIAALEARVAAAKDWEPAVVSVKDLLREGLALKDVEIGNRVAGMTDRISTLEKGILLTNENIVDEVRKLKLAVHADIQERLDAIEKAVTEPVAGPPGPQGPAGEPGAKGDKGDAGPAGEAGPQGLPGPQGEKGLDGVGLDGKDGRDGQPGVPGRDGAVGPKGLDGKDGVDGKDGLTTLETMRYEVAEDGLAVRFIRASGAPLGDWVQTAWLRPHAGVWREGEAYKAGTPVTWAGALWLASKDTTDKPQDGATAWRLIVKQGRPGRDGKDGKDGTNGRDGKDGKDFIR